MPHHPMEAWVDYARGAVSVESRAEMAAHLEAGCQECQGLLEAVQLLGENLREEAELNRLTIPLVAAAEAIFEGKTFSGQAEEAREETAGGTEGAAKARKLVG